MIACICSFFNYNKNKLRRELYEKFREKFKYPLLTAEIALDKKDFSIEDSHKILANERNILWQKERSFNILLQQIPKEYDKIAWVDTDICFENDNWLDEMDCKLDEYLMVQGFENVYEKSGNNNVLNCQGYGKCVHDFVLNNTRIPNNFAIGLCWGINRSYIPEGFYDRHILGSNDALQVVGAMGDFLNTQVLGNCTKNIVYDFLDYSEQQPVKDNYKIGYCEGRLEHFYHGNKLDRGYITREMLLDDYQFDPRKSLQIDPQTNLYYITDQMLQDKIVDYFEERNAGTSE